MNQANQLIKAQVMTKGEASIDAVTNIDSAAGRKKIAGEISGRRETRTGCNARTDDWSRLLEEVGTHRNELAFSRLFQHFAPLIKGFCLSNGSHSLPGEAAEELVQEVMVKVWLKSPSFDPTKAAASTWIFTVMRNCRIDMLRRNSRHQINQDPIDVDDIWDDSSTNEPFVRLQQSRHEEMIQASFLILPPEQKQVLAQVYMQGKSHSEIAEESGLPLGTVKSRVRMGLKKLNANLARRY